MGLKHNKQNGMSLVEVLLYISISTIIITTLSSFMFMVSRSRVKSQTITEVEHQGSQIISLISRSIRNAKSVSLPLPQQTGPSVSIQTFESTKNPTIFSLEDGKIFLKEGSQDKVQITSNRVTVTKFEISSMTSDSLMFRINIEITHKNPENAIEYNYTETFITSASIKNEYQ